MGPYTATGINPHIMLHHGTYTLMQGANMLSAARNAARQWGRPIQLMGFGDVVYCRLRGRGTSTSAQGIPDSGGQF